MPIPPESIKVDRCYLTSEGKIRRVMALLRDGRVQYQWRRGYTLKSPWRVGIEIARSFAAAVEREVSCDWTPETDEQA